MPKFNEMDDDKIIDSEQESNSGISLAAGEITHSDWDDTDWKTLQQDYVNMMNGCPVISTTWKLIEYPLMQSELRIEVGKSGSDRSKEAVDYLYWCFDNLSKKINYLKKHKLKAIYMGCSFHEIIEKRADKYKYIQDGTNYSKLTNRVVKMSPIQNDTINKIKYDKVNNLEYIEHTRRRVEKDEETSQEEIIKIDTKKLSVFTFNEEYDDIRGQGILRPVRFYFTAGEKVLRSKVIATERGAGIIGIHTTGKVTGAEKNNLEKLGRTIANMSNGYYLIDETRARVVLNELKGQQNVMELLQFINRMKFYNTMSQFLSAGIGESGSRAATIEHKAPYELALNYVNSELELNFQDLAEYFINISYLSPMIKEDYPKIKFSAITQADMLREAQVFKMFVDAGLQMTDVDWNMIREHINLPTKELNITNKQTLADPNKIESKEMRPENQATQMSYSPVKRKVGDKELEFEATIFEFESANEHFETVQEKIQKEIDIVTHELFLDIASQLKADRKRNIRINLSHEIKLIEKLDKIYEDSFVRGKNDYKRELSKLKKNIELALDDDMKQVNKNISKLTKRFYTNVKATIEKDMSRVNDKFLESKGGVENYVLEMEAGFKFDKRALITEVEAGYTDGRGNALLGFKDEVELYFYSALLDKNMCTECGRLDAGIYTWDELTSEGIVNTTAPVNLNCLGRDRCRCQIIPYKVVDK
ncbi:MAG: hypothetical protein KKH44_06065 [Bacteroidetes bacterium]|nr:hypothetical protein [Bacteroidota bacterium]